MSDCDLVFVVGNSRSGTTMTARLLGAHPDVHALAELHFFEELWSPSDGLAELPLAQRKTLVAKLLHRAHVGYNLRQSRGLVDEDQLACLAEPPGSAVEVFARTLRHEARSHDARIAVEQTPRNALIADQILELFPTARVISLVRDPRDVALSTRNWWKRAKLGSTNLTPLTTLRRLVDYHPLIVALLWRSTVRAADRIEDPRHLQVRFEDLAGDAPAIVPALCRHIGIDFDPVMLDITAASSSNRPDGSGVRGIDPSVIGRWRERLPRSESWIVERIAGAEMRRHGYPPSHTGPGTRLAVTAMSLPVKGLLATLMNLRRTRNPFRSALTRLR
jgi:hypothetical protein